MSNGGTLFTPNTESEMRRSSLTGAFFLVLLSIGGQRHAVQTGQVERIFGDYGKIQTLAVSPDGTTLAFSSDYRDGKGDIVVYNIATASKKIITRSNALESQPSFSPDGKTIYYFSNEGGTGGIFRVPTSGGVPERLTSAEYWCEFPTASPDGRYIVYYSRREGSYNLYQLDLNSRVEKKLTQGSSFDFGPVYSHSGKEIFFYSNRGENFSLFRFDIASGKVNPLPGPGGFTFQPTSDFNGRFIFCVSNVKGNNDIYVVSLSPPDSVRAITQETAHDIFPAVDHKNQYLYFISQREGDFGIYRMSIK